MTVRESLRYSYIKLNTYSAIEKKSQLRESKKICVSGILSMYLIDQLIE